MIAAYDLPVTSTITDYAQFPGQTEAIISVPGDVARFRLHDGGPFQRRRHGQGRDLLFKIDDRQYKADLERATKATKEQLEAHTNRLEKEYQRAKTLLGRGQISQEEHDRYESDFRETEAGLKLAKVQPRPGETQLRVV